MVSRTKSKGVVQKYIQAWRFGSRRLAKYRIYHGCGCNGPPVSEFVLRSKESLSITRLCFMQWSPMSYARRWMDRKMVPFAVQNLHIIQSYTFKLSCWNYRPEMWFPEADRAMCRCREGGTRSMNAAVNRSNNEYIYYREKHMLLYVKADAAVWTPHPDSMSRRLIFCSVWSCLWWLITSVAWSEVPVDVAILSIISEIVIH